jgi:hypothetical protein
LRLRGGGWGLVIYMPDGKKLGVDCPPDNFPIVKVYGVVLSNYPHIPRESIFLKNGTSILDPKKTIKDYNINYGNHEIYAIIPDYFFGSKGILKLMKISGYW